MKAENKRLIAACVRFFVVFILGELGCYQLLRIAGCYDIRGFIVFSFLSGIICILGAAETA